MKRHSHIPTILTTLLFCLAVPAIAISAELHVGPGQTYTTIYSAVAAAAEGDTITIHDRGTHPDYVTDIPIDVRALLVREAAGDTVSIGSIDDTGPLFHITANKVTIRDLDIFITPDEPGDYVGGSAIHLDGADSCTIIGNRCGWDSNHQVGHGIKLTNGADYNVISDNLCAFGSSGANLYLYGSHHNTVTGNTCTGSRDLYHTECAMQLYASEFNSVIGNVCAGCPRGLGIRNNSKHNTIAGNLCTSNTFEGIYTEQMQDNVFTDNTVTGNDIGIQIRGSDSIVARNTVSDNTRYGINQVSGSRNSYYLNRMTGNHLANFHYESSGTENTWHSLTKLSYLLGEDAYKGYMGNHYDDYAGVDADGDGIGDTPYVGTTIVDDYPLVQSSYRLAVWFLNTSKMYGDDLGLGSDNPVVPRGGSAVWVADSPATADVTFPAGTTEEETGWGYQIATYPEYGSPQNYLTLTLGYANEDGSGFTSVAGQPSTSPEHRLGRFYAGEFENIQEFTVPAGSYLALKIESDAGAVYDYEIMCGGAWGYISSSFPFPSYPMEKYGACCSFTAGCYVTNEDSCQTAGDSWLGYGTACDPYPCPQGACCTDEDGDEIPETCRLENAESSCTGVWNGFGTDCEPNLCVWGACCSDLDGDEVAESCEIVTEEECTEEWKGYQTECDPNPCDLPPCPAAGPPWATKVFRIWGESQAVGWSWAILPRDSARIEELFVEPLPLGASAHAIAFRFELSIEEKCDWNRLSASVSSEGPWADIAYLRVRLGGSPAQPFWLCVGPAGGPPDCCAQAGLNTCEFNPTMEEVPLSGEDCNGNGQDDLVDILFEEETEDVNENGVPDECETGACCFAGDLCEVLVGMDCWDQGGEYVGVEISCDPNPCLVDGVGDDEVLPSQIALSRPVPNPTASSIGFAVDLPTSGRAIVRLYDVTGKVVGNLIDENLPAGRHRFSTAATGFEGRKLGSGVYYLQLRVGEVTQTRTIVLTQ